jgi:hypothetical protein
MLKSNMKVKVMYVVARLVARANVRSEWAGGGVVRAVEDLMVKVVGEVVRAIGGGMLCFDLVDVVAVRRQSQSCAFVDALPH